MSFPRLHLPEFAPENDGTHPRKVNDIRVREEQANIQYGTYMSSDRSL
jgi:hypothetical protein